MAVTSQQIAELAGVSRGTVDRALHNRGRVNPEVAARVLKIAEELGYRPNSIGRALVRTKQSFRLGVILQSAETPTMQDVAAGARQAAEELRAQGLEVELREVQGRDSCKVLRQIDELLDWGAGGLAIASNNTADLVRRIDQLHEQGVPVVTFNTDAPDSRRLCFVGMDNYRAGRTAAGLIRQMLPGGGLVLPIAGHVNNGAHISRLRGFLDGLEGERDIRLLPYQPCFDRDDYAHEITQHTLQENPSLACVYIASNGQRGVCRAIEDERKKGRVRVIAYDLNEPNRQLLRSGDLSFVLDQMACEQGRRPLQILYHFLVDRTAPEKELFYTDILIRTRYNSGADET
ncbi:LacI family DNA-binding transcriptional regulator [uncultured Oscillibacter sp.]|uniref:LacI family DNA-binding transcriptional regulator n=1 Tax=uncultured Oscillibacter sp. TaxID=876091 RepID=UPI002633B929|nr:LacI family DNA-binding transcriptional regulator [uncultured Oscillibacter sp.]